MRACQMMSKFIWIYIFRTTTGMICFGGKIPWPWLWFFTFHNLISVKQEMMNSRGWCPLPFRPCITMIHDWVHLSLHIMTSICSRKLQSVRISLLFSLEAAVLTNCYVIIHSGGGIMSTTSAKTTEADKPKHFQALCVCL